MRGRRARWGRRLLQKRGAERPLPFNLADAGSPRWDERANAAVALMAEHLHEIRDAPAAPVKVADFGAGNERLRKVLASCLQQSYTYSPFDIHPQSDAVAKIDLTRDLPAEDFDVVFCLGLLEYVEPLQPFLRRLAGRYPFLVVSYALFDAPHRLTPQERRERGWRTDYTRQVLEREFAQLSLRVRGFALINQARTGVWLLVR